MFERARHAVGAAALLMLGGLASAPAASAEKTPSDVYRAVGGLAHRADALLAADFVEIDPARIKDVAAVRRRPRHVYAKLVAVADQVAMLRRLNGLGDAPILLMSAEEIAPREVFAAVTTLTNSMDELGGVYGLAPVSHEEPLAPGKKPGDVYARLQLLSNHLQQGYLPAIVPNDVYKRAELLHVETQRLSARLGAPRTIAPAPTEGKRPVDVLGAVLAYAEALDGLAARNPNIAPSGGVFVPKAATGRVTPAVVLEALNLTVADLLEMRARAGVTAPLSTPEAPVGRTPSDVFSRIDAARLALVATVSAPRAAAP